MKYDAHDILELLAYRHTNDLFVPECKTGPSQNVICPRMDAWAMCRSYAHFKCTGYEIKVSRSDFLADDKMRNYLPFCHELYVACPKGIVTPDELPPEIGLIEASVNCRRAMVRKKAPTRTVDIPPKLYVYILMSRADIRGYGTDCAAERARSWQQYVAGKRTAHDMGHVVSKRLAKDLKTARDAQHAAEKALASYMSIVDEFERAGINVRGMDGRWDASRRAREIVRGASDTFIKNLRNVEDAAKNMREAIDSLNATNKDQVE